MPLSLTARLRLTAAGVSLVVCAAAVQTGFSFFDHSIEQRLATTRAVVQQSEGIAQKYFEQAQGQRISADEARAKAIAEIKAIRYEGKEYVWINDMTPRMVAHPIKPELEGTDLTENKDPNGKRLFVEFVDVVKRQKAGYVDYLWPKPGSQAPEPKRSYVAGFSPWGWVLGSGVYVGEVRTEAWRFAAINGGLALAVSISLLLGVQLLTSSLKRRLERADEALREIAAGNLARRVEPGSDDEIGALLRSIEGTRTSLAGMVAQVRASTDSISTASSEIATGNLDLSERTEQTASNLQQTASSMEQLTGTVAQSADSARSANQLASSAAEVARHGGEVVARVVSTMNEIDASSKRIADIIGTIDGIAFQTNILALNAAVEAARAGEQGRGFAVVASEVRGLAHRSAEAAKEIKGLIGTSVEKVAAGSRLVQDAGTTMTEIVASVQRVSDMIGEITAASSEQSQGIGQVNTSVNELDRMTQQNAALVEQSAAAAESLKEQAQKLAGVVGTFQIA